MREKDREISSIIYTCSNIYHTLVFRQINYWNVLVLQLSLGSTDRMGVICSSVIYFLQDCSGPSFALGFPDASMCLGGSDLMPPCVWVVDSDLLSPQATG